MAKVAINGLGRIGKATFKILMENPALELVAANDLVPTDNLAYLLRYDTVYGRYGRTVEFDENNLIIDGKKIRVFAEKDPAALPWKDLGVDIVFECTGRFTKKEDLARHLQAGAKHAILSAPAKGKDVPTFIFGVNNPEGAYPDMISCASCTTNSVTPVVEIMGRRVGIKKAVMSTLHAYTSSQSIVDAPNKKVRRGRAAAQNLVPATTGAALATTQALPRYQGRFDAVAVRAPVPVGSISDIVFITERPTTVEEVNSLFADESRSDRYARVLGVTGDMIVSSDIIGDSRASIVDTTMTKVVDGDLVKVMTWYDNEWGYSSQMVRTALRMARSFEKAGV
ncbi:MAG: type I glyceraldehyde-3-phosphate dehydrogenase [Endomicrobiales bacterium]